MAETQTWDAASGAIVVWCESNDFFSGTVRAAINAPEFVTYKPVQSLRADP